MGLNLSDPHNSNRNDSAALAAWAGNTARADQAVAAAPTADRDEPGQQSAPAFAENVIPSLAEWQQAGELTALITLIDREGSSPRPIGAEVAVALSGKSIGHIASDCLGDAIFREASSAIAVAENRITRYGKNSPYMDLQLPCGSGIDLYFDTALTPAQISTMASLTNDRKPFTLSRKINRAKNTPPSGGPIPSQAIPHESMGDHSAGISPSYISPWLPPRANGFDPENSAMFHRNYLPAPRLLIAGNGPAVVHLARLAKEAGADSLTASNDDSTRTALETQGFTTTTMDQLAATMDDYIDPFTACVLMFHDHEKELPVYEQLLARNPFYIGAMGSQRAHDQRVTALKTLGFDQQAIAKIKGPAGLIPLAKNPALLALSILADVMQEAQSRDMIC